MRIVIVICIFSFLPQAKASPSLEISGFYSSDSFTSASTSADGKSAYAVDILTNLDNKKQFYGGFHIGQVAVTETTATTTTFGSLDMGPFVTYVIDQKGTYSFTVGYNVKAAGTYNDGTNSATWTGTSTIASFGVTPEVKDDFYVGFKINYYAATYTKEIITSTASDVSYSRAMIFPSFVLSWRH